MSTLCALLRGTPASPVWHNTHPASVNIPLGIDSAVHHAPSSLASLRVKDWYEPQERTRSHFEEVKVWTDKR